MAKIYNRDCDTCHSPYRGQGRMFCSRACRPQPESFLKSSRFAGIKHTEESREKKRLVQLGERGSNWKGGVTRENANRYSGKRRKSDINYRIIGNLRSRLNRAIRKDWKSGSAVRDLGCTIPELKFYLEGQFKDGMTWQNWSLAGWHIDHKIPLAFYDLTDREQFLKAVHYTNLQPMWAKENIKKSNKIVV